MATILFIVPRFHTNLFFATRALVQAGHRVELAAAQVLAGENHTHVRPEEIGAEPGLSEMKSLLARIDPDLVIARGGKVLIKRASIAARGRRARILRYNLEAATRVTPIGRRIKTALRGLPTRRITPVPGLDPGARRDPAAIYVPFPVAQMPHTADRGERRHVRILCVGKLAQRRKNQHLLIDALRELATPGRTFELTIVGATSRLIRGVDEAHYDAQVAAARAEHWITLLEDQPFEAMAHLYATHDICVLPSVGEPLGSAPIEGMAYGTIPVISTRAGAAGLVEHGRTGLRVDVSRDGALTDALGRLLDDPALRAALSRGARRFAETELSPDRYVARIEALLPPS